ncbi:MAG: hypothetical protein UU40_C0015G0023 [Candidatus Uhrbacteria bacterium GW2011_GWD2_41_121]|uniref:Uncharacterized protein n=1 Tax=Candidatus Uhrbacteria bacterium GW2011_GWC1_41_20 TaxID=1618983 RepID=A0A0G0XNR9_9BACT|nr:MAG: hypothetical protein UT52_C0015G0021 [Candidatus Uhrbacteria bacterium GW2011_GWE1_39_46]KKR63700.1 MAG: hypothetical protein UU04_C0014G0004 [Candidatus Uhrbacteria bacterium GW2011_GWC2_40_450]KKR89356.1 MAG: hypothetical protein UU36_C0032G0014 [Candidatus Uhrbacteria bacterium GW2011_GWE2_41_1153]KKR89798.1 MAG: hypothetical protein UU40_C0015G0023 [Candidatus Uhrbacteria bacterium GW2011_GWD2_41_121]KKR95668.1 MAG: hypothetical protein UU46_C0017G0021 [Candidatus Uhrbacteria bacter
MQKSKVTGIVMIVLAVILMIFVIGYTVVFSIFGISSGGSFLMITPLLIIAIVMIVALSFLLRAGIGRIKDNK